MSPHAPYDPKDDTVVLRRREQALFAILDEHLARDAIAPQDPSQRVKERVWELWTASNLRNQER